MRWPRTAAASSRPARHDRDRGEHELARARRRLHAGLSRRSAGPPAPSSPRSPPRWWVSVSWRPARTDQREPGRAAAPEPRAAPAASAPGRRITAPRCASLQFADAARRRCSPAPASTPGRSTASQTLAVLWERLHPAATHAPDLERLSDACGLPAVADSSRPPTRRHALITALCRRRAAGRPRRRSTRRDPGVAAAWGRDA